MPDKNQMKFIEMTGVTLEKVINDGELHSADLTGAGVKNDSIVRVNQQGDIEVRWCPQMGCDRWTAGKF